MAFSALVFREQFNRFKEAVRLQSGIEFRSFREGLPRDHEGYKEDVYTEGRKRLAWSTWKEADITNGPSILKRVIKAIEISPAPGVQPNNLVDWINRFGHKKKSHHRLLDALQDRKAASEFARVFYGLYEEQISDAEAFEELKKLAGGQYRLLAYLFFLKDWNRFMPIATKTFDKAFSLLEVDLKTAHHASWENYTQFNTVLNMVLDALRDIAGVEDARLIDAHSFCWMLVRLPLPDKISNVIIPLPEPVSSVQAIPYIPPTAPIAADEDFATLNDEDYKKRDEQRRRLGRVAQEIALESERRRLREANRADLADKVEDISNQPGRGYDILSFEVTGERRHIEVKAARKSGNKISFFLSENEWQKSRDLSNYCFYLVFGARKAEPAVHFVMAEQLTPDCRMPIDYFVRFRAI